jgi:outer membrane lipoprotein carrier protein
MLSLCLGSLLGVSLCAQSISGRLRDVEKRYNALKTLQVSFVQTYQFQGRKRPPESGQLFLERPGKMRWVYRQPAGKLFLTDGKDVYFYSPASSRVEKSKFKESADYRTPLAFLLGRLDFNRDFKEFHSRPEGAKLRITAFPKSDKSPYSDIEFDLTPANVISRVKVTGQDGSVMEFEFADEKLNAPLAASLFQFKMPAGAELVDVDAAGNQEN